MKLFRVNSRETVLDVSSQLRDRADSEKYNGVASSAR